MAMRTPNRIYCAFVRFFITRADWKSYHGRMYFDLRDAYEAGYRQHEKEMETKKEVK